MEDVSMRIVVAPQEYKGTLTAREAAEAIADGVATSVAGCRRRRRAGLRRRSRAGRGDAFGDYRVA